MADSISVRRGGTLKLGHVFQGAGRLRTRTRSNRPLLERRQSIVAVGDGLNLVIVVGPKAFEGIPSQHRVVTYK
jgi:hypothetical protein